jgi:hypothetical protein
MREVIFDFLKGTGRRAWITTMHSVSKLWLPLLFAGMLTGMEMAVAASPTTDLPVPTPASQIDFSRPVKIALVFVTNSEKSAASLRKRISGVQYAMTYTMVETTRPPAKTWIINADRDAIVSKKDIDDLIAANDAMAKQESATFRWAVDQIPGAKPR